MRRREFITLATSAAIAWPLAARTQQPAKPRRIAIVSPIGSAAALAAAVSPTGSPDWRVFFRGLAGAGYVEGQNLIVERFSAEGRTNIFANLAREVVRGHPDLIFAVGGRLVLACMAATTTIPIIGVTSDPIAAGIVTSLAHPGGNVTGVSLEAGPLWGKRLEVLKETVRHLSKVGFLVSEELWQSVFITPVREAFHRAKLSLVGPPVASPLSELEYRRTLGVMTQQGIDALAVSEQPEHVTYRQLITGLVREAKLPTIYPQRAFIIAGGLMAYAIDTSELFQHAADQVSRILGGASPAELPYYQATKFQLIINPKAAETLGLTFPLSLLGRADEVIE
jgi:putative tryptophan/tyrosine transport system substrate-binding protein